MRISESVIRKIIREEIQVIQESADELSDDELNALDTGPSHPQYHRAVRKAERLGGGAVHGNGRDIRDWSLKDVIGARDRHQASKEFLQQIESERGRAAVAEPMIALGMDPNNSIDRMKYKQALESAIGLESHLDDIIKLEKEMIFKQERDALSGKRSRLDPRGELEDRCFKYDEKLNVYLNNSLDCVSYRMRRTGKTPNYYRSEHVYDRVRLYKNIFGGHLGLHFAQQAAQFDPQFLKKVLDVTAKKLRPMPAYTPAESDAELKRLKVNIDEMRRAYKMNINESKIRQIIREEARVLHEAAQPGRDHPMKMFKELRDLIDEALMNKSFGFKKSVTEDYIERLNKSINFMNTGVYRRPDDDQFVVGSAGPKD